MLGSQLLEDHFAAMFRDYEPKERPVEQPEPKRETDLNLAVKRLQESLALGTDSPYFNDIADYTFNAVTDDIWRLVVAAWLRGEAVDEDRQIDEIMRLAIYKTANDHIEVLGVK
jgi:hypothetical protein